ncbi:MAG: tRNA methyl transferase PRC-barrel domain-containing protein [Ilumatobacteraceae bacterium]
MLHMLGQRQLARTLLPVGDVTKARVREIATEAGLRTAAKDESQDVCFITSTAGRQQFLAERLTPRPATVVDTGGRELATVASIEMVTIGQRRGLGIGGGPARYVVDIDPREARAVVGGADELQCAAVVVESMTWAADLAAPAGTAVRVQTSAHGAAHAASTAEVLDDATTSDRALRSAAATGRAGSERRAVRRRRRHRAGWRHRCDWSVAAVIQPLVSARTRDAVADR